MGRRAFEVFSGAFFESYDVRLKGMIEIYLAFEEGELVGISLLHHLLDVSSAEFIVYVKPSQRKKGIGFSLVQNIVDRAGETGLTDLFSFVAPGARTSKSVLEKAGFKAQELKMVRTLLTTQSNIHTNETSE